MCGYLSLAHVQILHIILASRCDRHFQPWFGPCFPAPCPLIASLHQQCTSAHSRGFAPVVAHVLAVFLEEVHRSRQRLQDQAALGSRQKQLLARLAIDEDNLQLLQELRTVDAAIMAATIAAEERESARALRWQMS